MVCLPSLVEALSTSQEVMMHLYSILVAPYLEYCLLVVHYKKDVEALDSVQGLFTRMIPGLEGMFYMERLD